jgi:hypothetical protein
MNGVTLHSPSVSRSQGLFYRGELLLGAGGAVGRRGVNRKTERPCSEGASGFSELFYGCREGSRKVEGVIELSMWLCEAHNTVREVLSSKIAKLNFLYLKSMGTMEGK